MRLIDADDFKKFLQALCKAGAPYEEVVQLLDKHPTAYDVEKVVAELEKESYEIRLEGGALIDSWHSVIDKNKAIDIVRKRGIL